MMDLIGKFLVGVVIMSNVDQYDLFDHYTKLGFTKTQIEDDLIFTLQERMANMSSLQKEEYGINDDFYNRTNLFDMYDAGRIKTIYDKKSGEYPVYKIEVDFDGDGVFSAIHNPNNTAVNFKPVMGGEFADKRYTRDAFFSEYFK